VLVVSAVLERPVFSVGRRQFRWADAAKRLDWEALRGAASSSPREISDAELAEAEARFRYERSLVAAEEMESWLERWELTVGEWRQYLRGNLSGDERAAWVQAVCSGALERAAEELAARAAAAEATGEPDLERAYSRFLAEAINPEALGSLLEARKADWIRVDCRTLVFPLAAAAREAALCVRDDGMALAEVASQAGVEMREHSVHLEDAADELGKALLSARTGELLGPIPLADRFALVLVDDKVEPALDDPEILRRVQEAARQRAIEREIVNRVTWHERV
jgi:hypothetical protein